MSFGGRTFADVAAFEVDLHGAIPHADFFGPPRPREVSPISVSNPIRVSLDPEIIDDIFNLVEEISSFATIFFFQGLWPSLSDLHAWIFKHWEPILDSNVHIFPNAKGFFIENFESAKDRKTIMCDNSFS